MNKPSLYDDVNHDIKVTCDSWQQLHQAVLTANRQQRENLLFQEGQLERHLQRILESYHRLLVYRENQQTRSVHEPR